MFDSRYEGGLELRGLGGPQKSCSNTKVSCRGLLIQSIPMVYINDDILSPTPRHSLQLDSSGLEVRLDNP